MKRKPLKGLVAQGYNGKVVVQCEEGGGLCSNQCPTVTRVAEFALRYEVARKCLNYVLFVEQLGG